MGWGYPYAAIVQGTATGAIVKEWLDVHGITAAIAVGALLVGFLIAGVLTRPAPPPIEIRTREPQPSPTSSLFVHVDGGVSAPGVYRLPGDARIFEAIDAAGGATSDAEVSNLNLAARVSDGQKLVVPIRGSSPDSAVNGAPGSTLNAGAQPTVSTAGAGSGPRININTATQRVLESLPGIGPVTAQRVIQYRTSNGPFTRVDQLRTAGVPAATYERIKDLVSID